MLIRTCPALDGSYPVARVSDAGAASYTANLYDLRNGGALLGGGGYTTGTEITAGADGDSWVLDLGHANVRADWDALTAEDAHVLVELIPNTGSVQYVEIIANDAEHLALLYADDAIYADADSANFGTAFPMGSVKFPCRLLSDACSILTARGFSLLDCKGSWDSNHASSTLSTYGNANGGCRAAGIGSALSARKATIRTRYTAAWYPHVSGEAIDLVDCTAVSTVVPQGFSFANFTNGSYFEGNCKFLNCRLQQTSITGNGAGRYGGPNLYDCSVEGQITMSSFQSPGCYGATFVRCVWPSNQTVSAASMAGSSMTFQECTGPFTLASVASGKIVNIVGHRGSSTITFASSCSTTMNAANVSGALFVVDQTAGIASLNPAALAHKSDLQTAAAAALTAYDPSTGAEVAAVGAAVAGLTAPLDSTATQAAVQAGLTAQGLTTTRAAYLDRLDAAVSSVAAAVWAYVIGGVALTQDSAAKWLRAIATALHVHAVWDAASGDSDGVAYNASTGAPDATTTRKRGYSMSTDLSGVTTGGADDEASPDIVITETATLDTGRPDMPTTYRGTVA